jgi:hypothetical protein
MKITSNEKMNIVQFLVNEFRLLMSIILSAVAIRIRYFSTGTTSTDSADASPPVFAPNTRSYSNPSVSMMRKNAIR